MKLIIDSTLDAAINGTTKVINLTTTLDGKQIELSKNELYKELENKKSIKTSQPSPAEFLDAYQEAIENNEEILVLTLSSKLSGTYQSATLAASMAEYDKITIYDTESTSIGSLPIYKKALECIKNNLSMEQILKELDDVKTSIILRILPKTLEYLFLGGRLSKTKYVFANLLLIKPVLGVKNGVVEIAYQSRGFKRGINDILKELDKKKPQDNTTIYLGYTNDKDLLLPLIEKIKEKYQSNPLEIIQIGTVVGTHVGIGGIGLSYQVKK